MMKFLIFGLGNIGAEYADTRHNIGFKILDSWAHESSIFFTPDRYGDKAEIKFKGRTFILIKPSTYMNLSGKTVNYWMQKEKVSAENIMIVTDDLALPFGTIRMRAKGSDGGHNGLKNINQILGHNKYPRLRFGIGSEFSKGHQVDYVLGKWSDEENAKMKERIDQSINAIKAFGTIGLARAMNTYNGQ